MDVTATRILQQASDNPEYQAIANYLMSRRAFPQVGVAPMREGVYGSFTTPGFFSSGEVPARGLLNFNYNSKYWNPKEMVPTAIHESTHAAEKQLLSQYYEIKKKQDKTDLDNQFLDNFQKIIGSSKSEISDWINKVAPTFRKDEASYRTKGNEALAFGVEHSAQPQHEDSYKTPAHINPSIATAFMLLLDQAQRVQNQKPASQGR